MDCHEAHRREKAANDLLDKLRHSHKYCGTCFHRIKHVYRPDNPELPDCFVGYQHPTPHAESGETYRIEREMVDPEPSPSDGAHYSYDDPDADDRLVDLDYLRNDVDGEPELLETVVDDNRLGTVCACGNVQHSHEDEIIRNQQPFVVADALIDRLREFGAAHKINELQLFDELVHGATVREAIEASVRL